MDQVPIDSKGPTSKWQFSLRSIFVVTTICAVYLGLFGRSPSAIIVTIMLGCGMLVAIAFLGVALGMTALFQWTVLNLRAKAPRLVAWIFGGEDNSRRS